VGKRQLYKKGETIHRTIPKHRILKIENNVQNKKANIKKIKKYEKAVTSVPTDQERRDKLQQCQTQYSAVHGADCVGRLSKCQSCVAFVGHQALPGGSTCYSVLCALIALCSSAEVQYTQ